LAAYAFSPSDTYVRPVVRSGDTVLYLNPIVRYDGRGPIAPVATIDSLMTWVYRLSLAIGGGAIVWVLWGRRRPSSPNASSKPDVNRVYERAARTASR
jgi:hypothetical protein